MFPGVVAGDFQEELEMSALAETKTDGFSVDGMSSEEYHRPENGVSTSIIKSFIEDPALVQWQKNAPQIKSGMKTLDFGTAFHACILEPDMFAKQYKVLPEFNRRKPVEKQAELDLIQRWNNNGITAVSYEDMAKLNSMKDSALSHPTVKAIMNLDNGIAERSLFWNDSDTGLSCKCRPDWLVTDLYNKNRLPFMDKKYSSLIMDVKTIARIDDIQSQIERFKYYIQDVFYCNGVNAVTGSNPCFVFVFVSTSLSAGRYPVKVVKLSDAAKFDGQQQVSEALAGMAKMNSSSDWQTVIELDRPMWATKEEDVF